MTGNPDLDVLEDRAHYGTHQHAQDIHSLIATVKALRARVTEFEVGMDIWKQQQVERAEAAEARVETARLEVEQCHAKSTCCCGDYMKHHTG